MPKNHNPNEEFIQIVTNSLNDVNIKGDQLIDQVEDPPTFVLDLPMYYITIPVFQIDLKFLDPFWSDQGDDHAL